MKRILFIFLLFSCLSSINAQNISDKYASSSIMNFGKWVKISVAQSGIYKLTFEDLQKMGINPPEVRIYGYGGSLLSEFFTEPYIDDLPEVAIFMSKGADNVFNSGDFILFYAQANILWRYGLKHYKTIFYHTRNHYSDLGYYFVTSKSGDGKRINLQNAENAVSAVEINTFTDYQLHEQEKINFGKSGREFYGEEFNNQNISRIISFSVPNAVASLANIYVSAASKSKNHTTMSINANGSNAGSLSFGTTSDYQIAVRNDNVFSVSIQPSNQFNVNLTYSNSNDLAYLNFVDVNVKRLLTITSQEFYFRNIDYLGQNQVNKFVLSNANNSIEIWEITDRQNITKIPSQIAGNQLNFYANTDTIREFLAINPNATFAKPTIVGEVVNQNLHALSQTDMVIVSHKDYISQAEQLASFHRINENLKVHVVDVDKVYNEFSSGTPDATAIRRLMKMFWDRADNLGKKPKFLLLFGDGTYDNRNLLRGSENFNKLPTYQAVNSENTIYSYVSDDYFGYLDDNDTAMLANVYSNGIEIGIGRFPVFNTEQANTAVDKTIAYMQNAIRGDWKNTLLFIADDGDRNNHTSDADRVADFTQEKNKDVLIKKLFLDAFKQETSAAGESYPLANNMLDNYIKQGVLMINYMGHGSYTGWSNEKLLTTQKIIDMTNDKYPIFVTATCDFSPFDQMVESAGEQLFWNKKGGTMALVTTTRTVFSNGNYWLNRYFSNNIFEKYDNDEPIAIGEVLRRAKNMQQTDNNKFAFMLIGNPALKLIYPYQVTVVMDSINYQPINPLLLDTVSALSVVNFAGHIETRYGDFIQNYNGYVSVNVFDKVDTILTLNNDNDDTNNLPKYRDRQNLVFKGSAEVKNGKFNITFMIPKDIRYNFGTGRIVFYTTEYNFGLEGNGSFENFVIGGENPNPIIDTQGPEVALFMNSHKFVEGQTINPSPLFIAQVYDESGINTIGSGVGHDIILRMNRQNGDEIVLNNYYTSKLGSYKEGKVEYQLSDLETGDYNLTFRVWDLQNNSTSKNISFKVSKDIEIDTDVDIYPNPTVNEVTFSINHDRPYKSLDITVRVYDLLGRHIWQSTKTTATAGNKTEIKWNLRSEGMIVQAGVYVVRIEIAAQGEKSDFQTKKLIIKTQ
jgi:hypothetical protein